MPSNQAFLVNDSVFFDPHPGVQSETRQKLIERVLYGKGASKYFLRGNRGGGKSLLVRRGVCHSLAMAVPGLKYVVVRRNYPDLESNHLIYVGPEMRQLGGTFNETKRIANYANGSMGFYRQCEEFRDVEKVVGAEAAVMFVDEAPQIQWDYLTLMLPSLRVPKNADGNQPYYTCAIFGGNPTGESIEELDKYFIDQDVTTEENRYYVPEDWEHIPVFAKDNPSIDPLEYLKMLGPIPLAFQSAWIDGVRMESRTLFDVKKTKDGKPYHYISELPSIDGIPLLKVPWIQVYRAFDMGYLPDPAVCVWFAVVGRRVIAFHEETWFRTEVTDLAASIIETTKELVGDTPVGMTYVDPQIAIREGIVTVMDHLEMHGVPCEPSINDRIMYADAIHSLLGQEAEPGVPRFQIYEPGCPMLAKYLPKQRWDEKNPRKMADHRFDHWIVAVAYYAISSGVLAMSEQAAKEVTEPFWMAWMREGTREKEGRVVFTLHPITSYDPNKISTRALHEAMEGHPGRWIPVVGDPQRAIGEVVERYPTPDDLYRWHPKEQ